MKVAILVARCASAVVWQESFVPGQRLTTLHTKRVLHPMKNLITAIVGRSSLDAEQHSFGQDGSSVRESRLTGKPSRGQSLLAMQEFLSTSDSSTEVHAMRRMTMPSIATASTGRGTCATR